MKGRARIYISDEVIQLSGIEIKKPLIGGIIWDAVDALELFDTWKSFLLLPDGYTIIGTFFDVVYYTWMVIVESDTLPLSPEGEMLPTIQPIYQRTANGKVSIMIDSLKTKEG